MAMAMHAIRNDPSACRIDAGDLEAVFLPRFGMLGASLKHRGEELLRRVDDLDAAAAKGSTAGIPLLHPWANRLASMRYRAAGREVTLDPASPLLHFDENKLPIHGVPWALLEWNVLGKSRDRVTAELSWDRDDLLAVFPFQHTMRMSAALHAGALSIETTLHASGEESVPVCFGFHPYFGIPNSPRAQWRIILPAMRRLVPDERGIPTGEMRPFDAQDQSLGDRTFDDGFALDGDHATFSIAGGGLMITIEFLRGYRFAQVYAPRGMDLIAIEPMTAPTNALIAQSGLRTLAPGERFEAAFRVRIDASASN